MNILNILINIRKKKSTRPYATRSGHFQEGGKQEIIHGMAHSALPGMTHRGRGAKQGGGWGGLNPP